MSDLRSTSSRPRPRSRFFGRGLGLLGALAVALGAAPAGAQQDLNPPLPNVMLLVDTSGSMEFQLDGTTVTCTGDPNANDSRSRWIDLVEVLTGTIRDYSCQAIDRSSSAFLADYDANGSQGQPPYDYLYALPYHRAISDNCVAAPGKLPLNAYEFPEDDPNTAEFEGAIRFRTVASSTTNCNFQQSADGILDAFMHAARFGLMTFDPLTDNRTGIASGSTALDYDEGMLGGFSYVVGDAPMANPAGCLDPAKPFEVGARNAAAPPWEGRMVSFGDPATGSTEFLTKKQQIEKILLATRPFGGTPIAGILHDARGFLLEDDSDDPLATPTRKFGPIEDPYINDPLTCRNQYVILLTDGEPNLDMRPFCEGGTCPFEKAEQIADDLVSRAKPIETLVVPFALPTFMDGPTERTCNDLTEEDFDEENTDGMCAREGNEDNVALQACCALNRIAVAGARPAPAPKPGEEPAPPPRAFFSRDKKELQSALSNILSGLVRVTSRTQPVAAGPAGGSAGFRFFSLVTPVKSQPWVGTLRRQRFTCDGADLVINQPDVDEGDDFGANIAAGKNERLFSFIEPEDGPSGIDAERTIRPLYVPVGAGDGAGAYGGTRHVMLPGDFVTGPTTAAMQITDSTCAPDTLNAADCRTRYLRWLVGQEDSSTPFSRCPDAKRCYLLGDILHSTPRVVGLPSDLLRDETYDAFAARQREAMRPVVLYTSSNDGFLHAFKVARTHPDDTDQVNELKNNELWAFVPPAILPHLDSQYPFTHQALLDGMPVVKDVVAADPTPNDDVSDIKLQRSRTDARQGVHGVATWRTILVQSFGPARGGYFALDVTDPVLDSTDPNDADRGPRFLWQLTTDASGSTPLFGLGGATPLITTLFFTPPGGTTPLEIPVAVLPGGSGGTGTAGTGSGCATSELPAASKFSDFAPRANVRCYSGAGTAGRSLTIVRLDTGEIVRTFRKSEAEITDVNLQARVTEVPIDSPITGQPAAFPADTGAVADRLYVGDQDGRLWRVNVAFTNPADWTMEMFFDTFPAAIAGAATGNGFDSGQPISAAPVLSVDERGDITVNVATGDQETLGASANMTNYVWSLTERPGDDLAFDTLKTEVNWYLPLANGERAVGPLVLFDSQLFFSTFAPPANNASVCSNGSSKVWGMDYIRRKDFNPANQPANNAGGEPRLPHPTTPDTFVQFLTAAEATDDANSIIFGVSVAQQPTCIETAEGAASDFFANQVQTHIRAMTPGKVELVMHRGGVAGLSDTGNIANNASTLELPTPMTSSRIDSWAALLE